MVVIRLPDEPTATNSSTWSVQADMGKTLKQKAEKKGHDGRDVPIEKQVVCSFILMELQRWAEVFLLGSQASRVLDQGC